MPLASVSGENGTWITRSKLTSSGVCHASARSIASSNATAGAAAAGMPRSHSKRGSLVRLARAHRIPFLVARLRGELGGALAREERVVGVEVLPLAVAAGEQDVVAGQPAADRGDVLVAVVVVDHVGGGEVDLVRDPHGIAGPH